MVFLSWIHPRFLAPRLQTHRSLTQKRCYLVEHIYTMKDGQLEDPFRASIRLQRREDSEGFQNRYSKYKYFEKPTKRRQREESELKYKHKKNEVMAIKRWIEEKTENEKQTRRMGKKSNKK